MTPIDDVIPCKKVLADVRAFLSGCDWMLEIDDALIRIPHDADLRVQTRAYVVADAPDIILGDHFEAVVILGCRVDGENWVADYGYLKLYYNTNGEFLTEDRYPSVCRE
jgi:hypothetical protein